MFKKILGISQIPVDKKIVKRNAVRGVVLQGNKILMIKTNKGDFKFPGGGVEENETNFDALKREIIEESGFSIKNTIIEIGQVIEQRINKFDKDAYFEMHSSYYICELDGNKHEKNLDEYELELGFSEIFIDIKDAIKNNQDLLENQEDINFWVERETIVLKEIRDIIKNRE